jgi:hypothetical protein
MNEPLDRLLSAYLDGTLSPARRAAVEKRLGEPRVAKRLAFLRALDAGVRAVAPVPTDVQSRRMWLAIKGQIEAGAAAQPKAEPWFAWLFKPSRRLAWGGSLVLAAAFAVVVLMPQRNAIQQAQSQAAPAAPAVAPAPQADVASAAAPAAASAPAPAMAKEEARARAEGLARRDAAPAAKKAELAESAPAPAPAAGQRTEVERALAEDPVDGLIERFLRERQQAAAAPRPAAFRAAAPSRMVGATTVAAMAPAAAMDESFDSRAVSAAGGGLDKDGFWDWRPAGAALNARDWRQAQVELEAAESQAHEPAERAFAASALTLLSAAGQPLQSALASLPKSGELRVLSAGVWQLQMDSRLAHFSQGVAARLPGFRVEGDSLLLDMTFDRANFSPGTQFTRVSGETPAKVFDAQSQPVTQDSFSAPGGAEYRVQDRELRLR